MRILWMKWKVVKQNDKKKRLSVFLLFRFEVFAYILIIFEVFKLIWVNGLIIFQHFVLSVLKFFQ